MPIIKALTSISTLRPLHKTSYQVGKKLRSRMKDGIWYFVTGRDGLSLRNTVAMRSDSQPTCGYWRGSTICA